MYQHIHQPIQVEAFFPTKGKPQIHSFVWQDKSYLVTAITLINKARKGRELVWLFHVATKTAAFKLRLDTDSLQWWLEEYTWDQADA